MIFSLDMIAVRRRKRKGGGGVWVDHLSWWGTCIWEGLRYRVKGRAKILEVTISSYKVILIVSNAFDSGENSFSTSKVCLMRNSFKITWNSSLLWHLNWLSRSRLLGCGWLLRLSWLFIPCSCKQSLIFFLCSNESFLELVGVYLEREGKNEIVSKKSFASSYIIPFELTYFRCWQIW